MAPDRLITSYTIQKSNSVANMKVISADYIGAKSVFSCWALHLSDWKALSKISQWLTAVWKIWFQLQTLIIYCHLTLVGIPKLAVNMPWGHNTRTSQYWDLRLFRRMHGLTKQLHFKKWGCRGWETKYGERPPIETIDCMGMRFENQKLRKKPHVSGDPRIAADFCLDTGMP